MQQARDTFDSLVAQTRKLLSTQLRAMHTGVFAPVQMISKYKPEGFEQVHEPPRLRTYTLADVQNRAPLSAYELKNSLIMVTYQAGRRVVLSPSATSHMLPNTDGVPEIPDLHLVTEILLLVCLSR